MTSASPHLRHRAAIVAWALRRHGLVSSWRQCVTVGLCVAASVTRGSDVAMVAEETMVRLVRAGELALEGGLRPEYAALAVADAWAYQHRLERAIASHRLGVSELDLIVATRGAYRPTWEVLARMSIEPRRRGVDVVYLDRSRLAEQLERFVAETTPAPSRIGLLMGWDGDL